MKKIFTYICILLAAAGCSTELGQDIVTTYTTTLEVSATNDTRVFDQDLKWSWVEGDQMVGLQAAGDMTPNTLTLNQNGKFFCEEFVYATQEAADFMFIYPAAAYKEGQICPVQNGLWTPILTAAVPQTTVSQISAVELQHLTAAMEVRVWESDKATRKNIVSATLTCSEDILFGFGSQAAVSALDTDTFWFNIAPPSAEATFTLTLTDTKGEEHSVNISGRTFVAGSRTIVNVAWKEVIPATVSFLAYSSYNESDGDVIKNDNLSGNTIYVKDVAIQNAQSADVASIKLLLNGVEKADITSGSATISSLAYGEYKVSAKLTLKNGYTYTTSESVVYVTGIPYHADWRSADYSDWAYVSCSDAGSSVQISNGKTGAVISPVFYAPNNSLTVFTAVAASTNATGAGDYLTGYTFAGTRSSSASKKGGTFSLGYVSNFSGSIPDTPLERTTSAVGLTNSTPCVVVVASDFWIACNTYIFQVKVTYN